VFDVETKEANKTYTINFTVLCTKPGSAQKLALFSKLWNAMATMAAVKDSQQLLLLCGNITS